MTEIHIAGKDLRGSLRSRFFIGVAVLVPLLVTSLFFFAFGGRVSEVGKGPGMAPVRVVVVNEDAGGLQLGRLVVSALSSPQLREILSCAELSDTAMARHALSRRQADLAVIIPAGFSSAVTDSAGRAEVLLLCDPVRTVGPSIVQGVLQRVLDGMSGTRILLNTYRIAVKEAGVTPDSRVVAGLVQQYRAAAEVGAAALSVRAPGAGEDISAMFRRMMAGIFAGLMVFFAFYTGAYTALSLVREHEEGTLARLFTTPAGRARILGGKMLSVVATVGVQATLLILASTFLFGLRWGQPGSSALALVGTVAATSGFGVMLASFIKTTRQGGPVLGGGLSVAGMLGGLFTQAVPSMPAAFNKVALALPQGWVIRGWNLAIAGRPPADLLVPFGVMLAWGAVCFAVGALVFRRRFA
ncbi:ABC transporter permease [candidate division WOR-3 bacterium]|uniref:ABC transporter permease n=1 Tax=candidate division WOR-3 bacterium TaxID=2052148 RepID=A0A938BNQ5_UNCW3|nr:ABC transporter permease [candidate division WOR-3 bacterium]